MLPIASLLLAIAPPTFAESAAGRWKCEQVKSSGKWNCAGANSNAVTPSAINIDNPTRSQSTADTPKSISEAAAYTRNPEIAKQPLLLAQTGSDTEILPVPGQSTSDDTALDDPIPDDPFLDGEIESKGSVGQTAQQQDKPSIAKQPGWSCESDEGDIGWNCKLIGADPAGQPHPVEETNKSLFATPTFNNREEMLFRSMMAKISRDPWGQCTYNLGPPTARISKEEREKAPVDVNADYSDIYQREIFTLSGHVDVTHADQKIFADYATYNTKSMVLNARGNVHYRDQDLSLYSDRAFLNLGKDQGRLRNAQFIYDTIPARGRAKLTDIESKTMSRYWDASYTTCAPGNQDWTLEAGTLELDRKEGLGTATNAWIQASGYPVFYLPYIEFPIDDRRKSGILSPTFGTRNTTGFDLSIPYYWNIAPNYDAIIEPRFMTRRGFLLGGEFRYLENHTNGQINAELIPYDRIDKKTRGAFSMLNATRFTPNLTADLDVNYVSDQDYINEIGNALSFTNFSHLRSQANLWFRSPGVSVLTRLENYQTVDPNIPANQRPYRRLPQVLMTAAHAFDDTDGVLGIRGEYVFFQRNNTVTGSRFNLKPRFNWPIETVGSHINPGVALDFSQYLLHGEAAGAPSAITRILPIVSLDSGLSFEREFTWGDTNLIQTLEPRLYYLYIPDTNQDDIPLFDTSTYDFTILSLFRDNRFNSVDRIGDANQVSVAVTSRILEPESGRQRLDGTLGTIVYFSDRNVNLAPTQPPETDTTSNIIAELNGQVTDDWGFRSGLQWNPYQGKIARGLASVHYQDQQNRILNLAYRFREAQSITNQVLNFQIPRGVIEQTDGSFVWPIFGGISAVGRLQYSLLDNKITESFLGLEKESCCWRLRIIGRHWIQTVGGLIVADSSPNTGVFFQLELKGFTSFGDNVDQFLERNIAGYKAPE